MPRTFHRPHRTFHTLRDAFPAVALVATIRTAFQAARAIDDRRAGRDPSAQEPEADVRADLEGLRRELAAQIIRLRLRVVAGAPDGPAALAQAFEDRALLDDLGRTLGVAHQKLLSLYPGVDEALVEAVRQVAAEARDRATADAYDRALAAFVSRTADLADAIADAAASGA